MEVRPASSLPAPPGIEDLEPVGQGGSATVYRGWQPAFGRSVAVKVIWGASPADLRHFAREARALGALSSHPHVVPVYDAGMLGGAAYLVMPYLEGGSLEDRLRRAPLDAGEVVRVGRALAAALSAAHERGILHRDVKPANVLFGAYDEVRLADFGIASLEDTTTQAGLIAATVAYAAPEVLAGEAASPASDVYGLAATLHAALSGAPPYAGRPGEAPIAMAYRIVHEPAPALDRALVPPALAAVVARAMSRRPEDRPATAPAFAAELAAADLRPAVAAPAAAATAVAPAVTKAAPPAPLPPRPVPEPGPRRLLRRRALAPLAAAAACVVVAALAVAAASTGGSGHKGQRAATAPPTAAAPTAAAPTTAAPSTTPPTTAPVATRPPSPPATAPPSGHGGPALVTSTLQRYYALVDAHQLQTSFAWLSPAYQARIGYAYYQSFWSGISRVDVESINPSSSSASMVLRYAETSGTTSTESVEVTFVPGPAGTDHPLIDTYTVR